MPPLLLMFIFSFDTQNCIFHLYGTCTYKDGRNHRRQNKQTQHNGIICKIQKYFSYYFKIEKEQHSRKHSRKRHGKHGCGCNILDNLNRKIISVTKQIAEPFNTGIDQFKCNYKRTQNGEQRPFFGRKIVKAAESENIKCRNKVKSHMTFAFYGKAETSERTFKTFDLLFHTP